MYSKFFNVIADNVEAEITILKDIKDIHPDLKEIR